MRKVPFLFTIDEKLVLQACVCISSLMRHSSQDDFYDIFILHSDTVDLSDTPIALLPETYPNCNITFRKVSGEFLGAYEVRGIPETCYYRLLSPELIPEYDKIIYSDVDVVFREDISRFYELDLGDNCFAGTDNCTALRPDAQKGLKERLGLDWHNGYYYSGNLVINLKLIREEGICKTFRELGKRNFFQQDMDIINIACNGRFLSLGPVFCLSSWLYELAVTRREEMDAIYGHKELDYALKYGIVHYNGAKPWNGWCHHYDIWWEAYRNSPVFDEQFYHDNFARKANEFDMLPLSKRLKILGRYFIKRR